MFYKLYNPIPEALRDSKALTDLFKKYNIVPYYGNNEHTSHGFLQCIYDATTLSPSHVSCKRDLKFYTFGHDTVITKGMEQGCAPEPDEKDLGRAEQKAYKDYLKSIGISINKLIELSKQLEDNLLDSGNAYLMIKLDRVGSQWNVSMRSVHYMQAAYLATKRTEPNKIIVTEYWTEDWWKKKRPSIYNASYIDSDFNWKMNNDGTSYGTILHLRNMVDGSPLYGRPDILPALYWMFVEFALANLSVKIAGTEFVSSKIIAFEEPDPARRRKKRVVSNEKGSGPKFRLARTEFQEKMNALRKLTTNEGVVGEAKALAGVTYAHGTNAPTTIDLQANRDTAYNNFLINTSSGFIYSLNGWDRQLTNVVPIKTNIGGNVLLDLFTIKNISTVLPKQQFYSALWKHTLGNIGAVINPSQEMHTIMFPNQVDTLILKLGEINKTRNDLKTAVDSNDGGTNNSNSNVNNEDD